MAWYNDIWNLVKFSKKQAEDGNYKFDVFDKIQISDDYDSWSAINKYFEKFHNNEDFTVNGAGIIQSKEMKETMYGAISTNKVARLASYRRMATFPEVGDAIDEICDESITSDENGQQLKLELSKRFDSFAEKEIQNSFKEFIEIFDFENRMFEYMRNFCIDGELAWENIISKDKPEAGILDIKWLPPESYEYAFNTKTKTREGLVVFSDDPLEELKGDKSERTVGGVHIKDLNVYDELIEKKALFLPWSQVTYINTGLYNSIGTYVLPVLERARRAYNQLAMIEDAIIIYRLVRAPERYVFNVDVGKTTRQRAEQEVLKMMKKYNTKKIYNPNTGTVTNDYDPHSMIESFWFAKSENGEGTTVDTLGGGQNLGELEDLHYFLRKLYLSLKIPFNRYEQPDVQIERSSSISYEEYRFAKFIMRLHQRFALGLTESFIAHLKLKGIWDDKKMRTRDIKIKFTSPTAFDIYEEQQRMSIKIDQYTLLADREEFSKTLCMKKYLGMSQEEVEENWKQLEKDAVRQAIINWKVSNAEDSGNPEPLADEEDSF